MDYGVWSTFFGRVYENHVFGLVCCLVNVCSIFVGFLL